MGACPVGFTVHHKDHWKWKNWASNLEYETRPENIRLSYAHSDTRRGVRHYRSNLTAADVRSIRELALAKTPTSIANEYHTTASHIIKIIKRKLWKHIA